MRAQQTAATVYLQTTHHEPYLYLYMCIISTHTTAVSQFGFESNFIIFCVKCELFVFEWAPLWRLASSEVWTQRATSFCTRTKCTHIRRCALVANRIENGAVGEFNSIGPKTMEIKARNTFYRIVRKIFGNLFIIRWAQWRKMTDALSERISHIPQFHWIENELICRVP